MNLAICFDPVIISIAVCFIFAVSASATREKSEKTFDDSLVIVAIVYSYCSFLIWGALENYEGQEIFYVLITHFFKWLQRHWKYLFSCSVCVLLNPLIQKLHDRPIEILYRSSGEEKEFGEKLRIEREKMLLNFGAWIGNYERFLYVFCYARGKFELAAGWFVMKAFFSWLADRKDSTIQLAVFNLYIFGNLVSLLFAITVSAIVYSF